jgi:hypothetical protein
MVAVIGAFVVLTDVNPGISPVPLTPKPIVVLEFVQTKLPPAGLLIKFVPGTAVLLQTLMFAGTITVGVGFTVMV